MSAGISAVIAQPIGGPPHNSKSWLEWFYSVLGNPGEVFWSSSWVGFSKGISKNVPLPQLAYVATYYSWLYGTQENSSYKLDNDGCTCAILRYASIYTPEKLRILIKSIFNF